MNIYESIAAIMGETYAVGKDKKNQQQNFNYRGIDDVMNTFQPLLAKHKVFIVPEVVSREREERQTNKGSNLIYSILTINYHFYAEDGSSITATVVGEGMDSGDKASNKAMAVAMKYALFQTFCIPTEEMAKADPDGDTPPRSEPKPNEKPKEEPQIEPLISPKEVDELILLINRKDADISKICGYYEVKSLKELTRSKAEHLKATLASRPDVEIDNPFLDDIPR